MNHVMHKPWFGKQESQEFIQESWNQVKIPKIPESCWQKLDLWVRLPSSGFAWVKQVWPDLKISGDSALAD